ncbi:MAG: LPXTG cell wall anchor domain-containing protein [Clostridiales bacterium]|nr:LPXTG cell wall anchor domain-containing protein [Clostridiales bacterium]
MKKSLILKAASVLTMLALALVVTGVPAIALATVDTVEITAGGSTTIRVGDQLSLSATINAPPSSATLTDPVVYSWTPTAAGTISMSPTNAASTTVTGRIPGTQTVTLGVSDADTTTPITDTIDIIVSPMTLSPSSVTLATGASTTLVAANYTGTVGWVSSNTGVATVSASGVVTAVGSGTATITATNTPANSAPAQSQTCVITVPTVTLNPSSQTISTPSTATTLTLTVTNGGTVIPAGTAVTWSSSNTSLGTLSSTSTTIAADGTSSITFTSNSSSTNGSTTITAVVGAYTRTASVSVQTSRYLTLDGPSTLNASSRYGTYTLTLHNSDGSVVDDDTSTAHWSWSSSYLSMPSNSLNDDRADMENGQAQIQLYARYNTPSSGTRLYAWINSASDDRVYTTIVITGLSSLPQTGQDMTLVYVFGGLGAALLAAAGVWYGIRKKRTEA